MGVDEPDQPFHCVGRAERREFLDDRVQHRPQIFGKSPFFFPSHHRPGAFQRRKPPVHQLGDGIRSLCSRQGGLETLAERRIALRFFQHDPGQPLGTQCGQVFE